MTLEQAKFILQAYRPGQDISELPEMQEALQLMETHPEVQQWFEEEQAFDAAFSAKLSSIEIPDNLKAETLGQVVQASDNVVEFPWWKQISVLGAVASMLLVLGLVLLPTRQSPIQDTALTIESFQAFANQTLKSSQRFNSHDENWGELVKYLNKHETPAPANLPDTINNLPTVGCMALKFQNKPVGMICFGSDSKSHLFVVNSSDFPDMPKVRKPVLNENPYTASAYWSGMDRHYLLVANDAQELVKYVSF